MGARGLKGKLNTRRWTFSLMMSLGDWGRERALSIPSRMLREEEIVFCRRRGCEKLFSTPQPRKFHD